MKAFGVDAVIVLNHQAGGVFTVEHDLQVFAHSLELGTLDGRFFALRQILQLKACSGFGFQNDGLPLAKGLDGGFSFVAFGDDNLGLAHDGGLCMLGVAFAWSACGV